MNYDKHFGLVREKDMLAFLCGDNSVIFAKSQYRDEAEWDRKHFYKSAKIVRICSDNLTVDERLRTCKAFCDRYHDCNPDGSVDPYTCSNRQLVYRTHPMAEDPAEHAAFLEGKSLYYRDAQGNKIRE